MTEEQRPEEARAKSLSVVLPAYRAADFLASTLTEVDTHLSQNPVALRLDRGYEILVVDDGSDDDTASVAERSGLARVIRLPVNRGKGAAVRNGMLAAGGEIRLFMDCDIPFGLDVIRALVDAIHQGADIAIGDRFLPGSSFQVEPRRLRRLASQIFTFGVSRISLRGYRDTQCGAKAFRGRAAENLFGRSVVDSFAFDVEILYLAHKSGLSLSRVPVRFVQNAPSQVRLFRDPQRMLLDLVRIPLRHHWQRLLR